MYFQVILRNKKQVTEKKVAYLDAPTEGIAAEAAGVKFKGYEVTALVALPGKPKHRAIRIRSKILRGEPLIRLCRGVASMVEAGITLEEAIYFYSDGLEDKKLAKWLLTIRDRMRAGVPSASAFRESGHFDDVFCGLVEAGTKSASLNAAFESIADRTEMVSKFKSEFLKAVGMPVAVLCISIAIFIASMCNAVPQIESLVDSFNTEPEGFVAFVFAASHFTQNFWPFFVFGALAFIFAFIALPTFRESVLSLAMSRVKVLRDMIMGLRQLLIISSMSMLTNNKISIRDALETTARIVKGSPMAKDLETVSERYVKGLALSAALEKYSSFDKAVIHMIRIGEASSSIEVQLERLTKMYERLTSQATAIFTRFSSVTAMLCALTMIGFVFAGTVLPSVLIGPKLMQSAR